LKNGEKQSETWVDMALGNNPVISEKMKEIQKTTKVMVNQNEVRAKRRPTLAVLFSKESKEEKSQDLSQNFLKILNSDITGCKI